MISDGICGCALEVTTRLFPENLRLAMSEHEEDDPGTSPGAQRLTKRDNIIYCGVCGAPPEYCENNPANLYEDCLKWLDKYYPQRMPQGSSLEQLLADVSLKESKRSVRAEKARDLSEDDVEGESSERGKTKRGGGLKPLQKKVTQSGGEVKLTRSLRNRRKCVTVINGLDSYPNMKLKDVAKALGKAFACGTSVSEVPGGGKEIVVQGDVLDSVADVLVEKYDVPGDNIKLFG